ncbi:MAG TPA: hypothetical protein VMX17_08760, partial [Candidatus Glassbacteria bacterium]|nr:hypothetical protein [Candidatus Glassbacteria bacterium]
MNITYLAYDLDLPNPRLGDSLKFTNQGIKRVMPSGILKVFKDSTWPIVETFTYDLYALTETQRDTFISLINDANGKAITITDHNGTARTGYIVTPTNEILTMSDDCWYDVHFEFMANAVVNTLGDCRNDISSDTPVYGDS